MGKQVPGDGSPLKPFKPWQAVYRTVMGIEHAGRRWDIDVDFLDWTDRTDLYRDGRAHLRQTGTSARFDVGDGAHIVVAQSTYGLKRAHLVLADGSERQLDPVPGTAERWRADLDRDSPVLSRRIGAASWTILVLMLVLQVPQWAKMISEASGWFEFVSPISLPSGLNTALTILGVLAAIERALRLRYHWLLD